MSFDEKQQAFFDWMRSMCAKILEKPPRETLPAHIESHIKAMAETSLRTILFSGGPRHGESIQVSLTDFRWNIMVTPFARDVEGEERVTGKSFTYVVRKIHRRDGHCDYVAEYQGDGGLDLSEFMDA